MRRLCGALLGALALALLPGIAASDTVSLIAGGDVEWSRNISASNTYIYIDGDGELDWIEELPGARLRWLARKLFAPKTWGVPYLYSSLPDLRARLGHRFKGPESSFHEISSIRWDLPVTSTEEVNRYPFIRIAPLLRDADIAVVNLETPLSDRARHAGRFRAPTAFAAGLEWAGIDVVATANNHALDGEEVGLYDTLESLARHGIGAVGTGRDLSEATRPVILERNGLRVGFLAYTQHIDGKAGIHTRMLALPDRSGAAPMDPVLVNEDIRRLNPLVDHVVVSLHWGLQNSQDVYPQARSIARAMIDNGADVILGHGPHLPQGIEIHNGRPIVYSLGNFIFGHGHSNWMDNILARVFLTRDAVARVEVLPIAGDGPDLAQPFLLEGERAEALLRNIQVLSRELGSDMAIAASLGVIEIQASGD